MKNEKEKLSINLIHHCNKKNKISRNKPKETKTCTLKLMKKLKKTQTDGKIFCVPGLEESILLK